MVVVAFVAGSRVADTRQGLVAEVIALLAGLVGISLVLYGLFANIRLSTPGHTAPRASPAAAPVSVPSARDLVLGAGGLALAALLLSGLGISGGLQWAGLGLILLLPMVAGSVYLCVRFIRAPRRDWKVELWRPKRRKET